MKIINLDEEIAKAPDSWFVALPDIKRLFLKGWDRRSRYSARMSYETRKLLETLPFYKEHFHKIYPSLHNDSINRNIDGWVIKDPRFNKFYLYLNEPDKYLELDSLEELSKIDLNCYKRSYASLSATEASYSCRFTECARWALMEKTKSSKKNNPELLDGIIDVAASKSQLTIMTKFNRLDNQIMLFKTKLTSNDAGDLYKQDLDDLFSAFICFKNSIDKNEIYSLKSRPKEKKKK